MIQEQKKGTNREQKILVLGANGKTGSRIVQRLTERGWPVQKGSRTGEPRFDWEDATSWASALQNIGAVYIAFQPDLAVPGAIETIRRFTKMAVEKGVRRLVLLSGRGETEAEQCEQAVMGSGAEWTIVRASWFCQNFSESYLLEAVLEGEVVLPVGQIGEPFIDADDIADVAVAALTEDGHDGKIYEVTGPRLLTFAQAVEEIVRVTGRPIRFMEVPVDVYIAELKALQVPDEFIHLLVYLFTEVLDGRNASLGNGVYRALGRLPTDFSEYARRTAASGIWRKA